MAPDSARSDRASRSATAACGNGIVEVGESCDGDCPTVCDDLNSCTKETLTGSPQRCNVACTVQLTARTCGTKLAARSCDLVVTGPLRFDETERSSFVGFGAIPALGQGQRTLTLRNAGTADCTLEGIGFVTGAGAPAPSCYFVEPPTAGFPLALAPAKSISFRVFYVPAAAVGHEEAQLRVRWNKTHWDMRLRGVSTRAGRQYCDLSVPRKLVDFGRIDAGESNHKVFEIRNIGSRACTLLETRIVPTTAAAATPFEGLFVSPGRPGAARFVDTLVVRPAQLLRARVQFMPQTRGYHRANVRVYSDDPATPVQQVPLYGRAIPASGW